MICSLRRPILSKLTMLLTAFVISAPAAADRLNLGQACEIAIAKSALPKRLRQDVSVYALNGGSFKSLTENLGTPSVFQEGPHCYMLTYVEHRADPDEVAMACKGQLGERPPPFNPFPAG